MPAPLRQILPTPPSSPDRRGEASGAAAEPAKLRRQQRTPIARIYRAGIQLTLAPSGQWHSGSILKGSVTVPASHHPERPATVVRGWDLSRGLLVQGSEWRARAHDRPLPMPIAIPGAIKATLKLL